MVDLEDILLSFSNSTIKPYRTLLINGTSIRFLCDSGADTSVLTEEVTGMWPPVKQMFVKSANGQIDRRAISQPLKVIDKDGEESRECKLAFMYIPNCPCNLLGRSGMALLGISLIPVTGGMRAAGPGETIDDQIFVQEGVGEPFTYWSLDLPSHDPTGTADTILSHVTKRSNQIRKSPDDLHLTVQYNHTPGPDPDFQKNFDKLTPQRITLRHLYEDRFGNTATSAIVPAVIGKLMGRGHTPHIALARQTCRDWKDLSRLVYDAEFLPASCWSRSPRGNGWERTKDGRIERRYLGYVVQTTPRTHLSTEVEG